MKKRNLRKNSSGQVIIITALLVATLLLSTAIYIIETEKAVPTIGTDQTDVLTDYEQSTKNTLISALANITNGGPTSVLTFDLTELSTAITSHSYRTMVQMGFTPLNTASYLNGVWVSWGQTGLGISSAYVAFSFNSSASSATSNFEYNVNVTSEVTLIGKYQQLNDTLRQANIIVNVFNEGKPALAQNFTFSFQDATGWIKAPSPSITDFGNGTYAVLLNAQTDQPTNPFLVSALCQDQRGIVICANATCMTG